MRWMNLVKCFRSSVIPSFVRRGGCASNKTLRSHFSGADVLGAQARQRAASKDRLLTSHASTMHTSTLRVSDHPARFADTPPHEGIGSDHHLEFIHTSEAKELFMNAIKSFVAACLLFIGA